MKVFNTYQEAKIANPGFAIFERDGVFGTDGDMVDHFELHMCNYKECDPADYCMTVEQFLKDGYKFEVSDLYITLSGNVEDVHDLDFAKTMNGSDDGLDHRRYILRAKALEEPKQVEWENGDLVTINNPEGFGTWDEASKYLGTNGTVMAVFTNTNGKKVAAVSHDDGVCICWMLSMLSKPETPEQKEERERQHAVYDMCSDIDNHTDDARFWCGKIYDAGYRK